MKEVTGVTMSVQRSKVEGVINLRVDVERIGKNTVTLRVGDRTRDLMSGDSLYVTVPVDAVQPEQLSSQQIEEAVCKVVKKEMPRMLSRTHEWCDDCQQRLIACRCP